MDFINQIKKYLGNARDWLLDLEGLEWLLPIFLAVTAIVYELVEHVPQGELYDLGFIGEMIMFGIVGPLIIRGLIRWMRDLLAAQKRATTEINVLNRDLENKVNERTATLEQRNAELDRLNTELRDLDQMKSD